MVSLYEKVDQSLHSAIDKDQVLLMELEAIRAHLPEADSEAEHWLYKIEQLIFEQGQLLFQARKDLRESTNRGSIIDQLKSE